MRLFGIALLLAAVVSVAPPLSAQEKKGAVLLLPESDMDGDLASDLTEVLISALIDKSGKAYAIVGKESFKKQLQEAKAADGNVCLLVVDCVREKARELGFALVVFGKVGKAMGGYRLEVWHLSMTGKAEKTPYRKRVDGDLEQLIREVEAVADWVLAPEPVPLTVTVNEKGAEVLLDGKKLEVLDKPVQVAPGPHTLTATKSGFQDAQASVTCLAETPCMATLTLVPVPVVKPDGDGKKPEPVVEERTSLWPWVMGLSGLAVLSAGGGVYMYSLMVDKEDEVDALVDTYCGPEKNGIRQCNISRSKFDKKLDPIVEDGQNAALWSTILSGLAIGSAAGALTFLVLELTASDPAPGGPVTFVPMLGPEGAGFVLETSF